MSGHDPLAASRSHRFRVGTGAAIVLVLLGLVIAVLVSAITAGARGSSIAPHPVPSASGQPSGQSSGQTGGVDANAGATIYVHILGEVNRPGLYSLRDGDRAIDAIAAAGGYTTEADRHALNLARYLSDGEQIDVPAVGAVPSSSGASTVGGKVNLNTADAATLETLPRVGPAMAQKIIQWRQDNGRFTSIEDLLGVSGIGEKTFAGLKDLVSV